MSQFDKFDIAILNILQEDSTISVKNIAEKIGLSATPTYERVKRMEQDKVITKYVALVDREKVGVNLLIYCNIILKEQSKKALMSFENSVKELPEILEVISISGTYDYMLKIVAKDINAYNDFVVNVISNIPNIGQYHSNIVMNEVKRETAYRLGW